jgi:MFS family permease
MNLAFWTGSISASFGVARLGNIRHRGRLVVLALLIGGGALMLFAVPTPLWLFYTLVFAWGTGAGLMISMARTIVQENAPPAHLARVMSVYQLGFTGGMPIGAFLLHFVVPDHGARSTALIPGGAMIVVLLLLLTTTALWRIRSPEHSAVPSADALAPAD